MIDQIGKYRILKKLGQGGFGDVYLAEDTVLGNQVALKVLAAHYLRNPTVVERFRQEARAAARLRHPNIVRIYDLGQAEGLLYLAMDPLPGRTLAEVIAEEGPLPLARAAELVEQLASALDHAHEQGLVHRDVKPGNVIVDERDHATLTDFGLVKAVEGTEFSVLQITSDSERFTTGGTMIGTPEYMAPEQAEPALGEVGPQTDLYALGVVAYQMLTGRVPFKASTPIATLRGHVDLEPPPPEQWVELPDEVVAALMKALAKEPGRRWTRGGQFARVLVEAAQRQEAARTEEQEMAALYAQAQEALGQREWARLAALCVQVMDRRPGYADVDALYLQASEGLARQKRWEAQQGELTTLYEEAERQMEAEAWEEAIATLERLMAISGEYVYRDTPQRLAQATAARERAEARRLARAEDLRQRTLDQLEDVARGLDELAALLPDNSSLVGQRRLAEAMLKRWTGGPADDEEGALLAAKVPSATEGELDSPAWLTWLRAKPWLFWAVAGIVSLLALGLIVALAVPSNPAKTAGTVVAWFTQTAEARTARLMPEFFDTTTPTPASPTVTPWIMIITNTPLPTDAPTWTPMPEPTSTLAELLPTATHTPTGRPTWTPMPEPTSTLAELPPTATRTPTSTPETGQPAPTLLDPTPGAKLNGRVTFRWQYPRGLRSHEAFQILIWREGETQHNGAAEFVRALEQTIDLDHVQQLADAGQYLWSVVLVDKNAGKRISPESDAWPFEYTGSPPPPQQPTREGSEPPPLPPTHVPPPLPPTHVLPMVRPLAGGINR